eukprot:scaffold35241_cov22-Tisochrysis_lutea.AAC.1
MAVSRSGDGIDGALVRARFATGEPPEAEEALPSSLSPSPRALLWRTFASSARSRMRSACAAPISRRQRASDSRNASFAARALRTASSSRT